MLEYLEKLVSFHPVTSDQDAVLHLLEYVSNHVQKLGYKATFVNYEGIHNLYLSPTGSKHSKVLLQAHVDVVPGGQPLRIEGDTCYGRGTYDMLFAVASYLKLVDELYEHDQQCDIALMLSGDEETGGFNGVQALLQDGYTTDVCILPDAGEGWGSLNASAKGLYVPTIRIHGRSHHGSRPWEGDGAALKLIRFVNEVEALFDMSDQHNSMLTVSILKAGETHNQGPSEAEVTLDIRYKDKADLSRITVGLESLLKKYNGEIIRIIEGNDYKLNIDAPVIQNFIQLYEKHIGQPINFDKAHASSDARFFTDSNIPVVSIRPNGGEIHSDHEWLSLSSFEQFHKLLKDYVLATAKL